jgi:hypothetical protein
MRKLLGTIGLLCALVTSAAAQDLLVSGLNPAHTGSTSPIAVTGYSVTSGPLFALSNTKLQFGTPYSIAYWIQSNAFNQSTNWVLDASGNTATAGFKSGGYYTSTPGTVWNFFGVASNNNYCANKGQSCTRLQFVNDANWHLVVNTFDGVTAYTYIDGIMRDQNAGAGNNYAVNTSFLAVVECCEPDQRQCPRHADLSAHFVGWRGVTVVFAWRSATGADQCTVHHQSGGLLANE